MLEQMQSIADQFGIQTQTIVIGGLGLGVLLLFVGITSILNERNIAAERMSGTNSRAIARQNRGLLRSAEEDPKGIMRTFVPTDQKERGALWAKLSQAGYPNPSALRLFIFVRLLFGLLLPGLLLAIVVLNKMPGLNFQVPFGETVSQYSSFRIFQILTVLVALGYYLPNVWLDGRVRERRQKIEEAFPNALDLMQISVEAGLGFDAAMTRVGNELAQVTPEIAFEFLTVQRQVQAGRDRSLAMRDMAERTGVETVRSFANVVQQSMQFGTSMSEALTTYANEMRDYREMKAQEMANKLPVKMSAVLASLMLPALLLLTLGPVVIRYMRFYG
jgi:tight adherence protein C